ncbi:MAG: T9SS type A sorting domain-containing protein [Bacteroidales bacterium]|nr:T9SS type A sorting domain-containing protein [Bacteroidales bacterium]
MTASGKTPRGNPVQAANGKLYGIASEGGLHNGGVLWEYDIILGIFTKKQDFDGTNKGSLPVGTLIEFDDNQLYGLCFLGGLNNGGVLFRYDTESDNLSRLVNFDGLNMGGRPMGSLMVASNNKIYGTTDSGGAYGFGVVFEFNPLLLEYSVIYDFREFSHKPFFGALIEVESDFGLPDTHDSSAGIHVYPNPAMNIVNIKYETRDIGPFDIRLINQFGQIMMTTSSEIDENNILKLDVSGLEAGIYFLQITKNGQSTVSKFVKTN